MGISLKTTRRAFQADFLLNFICWKLKLNVNWLSLLEVNFSVKNFSLKASVREEKSNFRMLRGMIGGINSIKVTLSISSIDRTKNEITFATIIFFLSCINFLLEFYFIVVELFLQHDWITKKLNEIEIWNLNDFRGTKGFWK